MDKLKKAEYYQQLVVRKKKLEKELANLEEEILQNQEDCEHVSVIMKGIDSFPGYGRVFRCLFCGEYLSKATEFSVDARKYLADFFNDRDKKQREAKFDILRIMAMGILRENPEMTLEEFTLIFNNKIQESIALEKNESNQDKGIAYKRNLTKENFKGNETN